MVIVFLNFHSVNHLFYIFLTVNYVPLYLNRFNVRIEWIRPEKPDAGTTIEGLRYIDVAGNSKREYRLSFFANKESQPQIKVC